MFKHDVLASSLRNNKCRYLLDIGSNNGDWAVAQKRHNPELFIYCVDGNEKNAISLKRRSLPYEISLLSDVEKEVKFYFNKNNDTCTGMSYYMEKNDYYLPDNYTVAQTSTLNHIIRKQDIIFDSIKIDTQGAEIDILKGADEYINNFKVICLETAINEYNIGSPNQDFVIQYMYKIGYEKSLTCGQSRYPDGQLFQEDLIFTKK